jgi:hypothetical protein
LGYTQQEIGDILGESQQTINYWFKIVPEFMSPKFCKPMSTKICKQNILPVSRVQNLDITLYPCQYEKTVNEKFVFLIIYFST